MGSTTKAFDLGGGARKKKKPPIPIRLPSARVRKITKRDIEREALKQAGAWDTAKKIRNTPTDLERLLKASGYGPGIALGLSESERKQFEADLSFLGILPGRTAGTLPERLVAKYLWQRGLPYEGMGYAARLYRGWAFQLPTIGGRSNIGGGAVLDIAIAASASLSGKVVGVRVNGLYWHTMPGAREHDARQKAALEKAGYQVADIFDYEVEVPGILDAKMRAVLR